MKKLKVILHSDGLISITTKGIDIKHGKNDNPKFFMIEANDEILHNFDKIKVIKKGKKMEIEIPGQEKQNVII